MEENKQELIKGHETEINKLQKELFDLKSKINKLKNETKTKDNDIQKLTDHKNKLEKIKEENETKIKQKDLELDEIIISNKCFKR